MRRCRSPTCSPRCRQARATCWGSIRLFDVYTGDQVGAGKSLAFRLRFRAPDRTLIVEETSAARDAAVAAATEPVRCGAAGLTGAA
ncbi:MAG: hypothetical protein R2734_01920 [Nocardioides sp.]